MRSHKLYILLALLCVLYSACSPRRQFNEEVDRLNDRAFDYRYSNVDSTYIIATRANILSQQDAYNDGIADALLNMSFYHIVRMEYDVADALLNKADSLTDDDVIHMQIDVQRMRICQRKSLNKDFYLRKWCADKHIGEVRKKLGDLTESERKRYNYARIEYGIVLSTYLYYVQLYDESSDALLEIGKADDINLLSDPAQYVAYLYNIGAGGILKGLSDEELLIQEYNYLVHCYLLSRQYGFTFWQANSLQSLAEHLYDPASIAVIRNYDPASLKMLNEADVPDDMLAGYLTERALHGFVVYGDIYQIAGTQRTLSQCYQNLGDHETELVCLLDAIDDSVIYQAPDLVASIDEKLSLAYAALDDKQMSDYYRNEYLDIQDSTRQDRQLEARAEELSNLLVKTRTVMAVVVFLVILLAMMTYLAFRGRKKRMGQAGQKLISRGMDEWNATCEAIRQDENDTIEELEEQHSALLIQKEDAVRVNVEQRARISFVLIIMPLIDRMLHATKSYRKTGDSSQLVYVSDLCDSILQYNTSLTKWVQLKKGQINMRIESFDLKDVFDIVALGKSSFNSRGVNLVINDAPYSVKADKALTLFIINTLLDNARKYSPEDGTVVLDAVESAEHKDYVEISVKDNGAGMTQENASALFDYKPIVDEAEDLTTQKSHGFGLMNCRGIISRYKKTSELFSHCDIFARSEEGKGTTVTFLLPKAVRMFMVAFVSLLSLLPSAVHAGETTSSYANELRCPAASALADSVYKANVDGRYQHAIEMADSCLRTINVAYRSMKGVDKRDTLSLDCNKAELHWMDRGIKFDYMLIAYVRNEIAVAALALHDWTLYEQNNKSYTVLYRECSKDTTLNTYCQTMEETEMHYNFSVLVLGVLLAVLLYLFWWYYIREKLNRRRGRQFVADIVAALNASFLDGEDRVEAMLRRMEQSKAQLSDEKIQSLTHGIRPVAMEIRQSIDRCHEELNTLLQSAHDQQEIIDVLRRERDMINVNNNVIDNTLSSLKHETMYFPSRISRLVADGVSDELLDVVTYYRSLYAMLSAQCARNQEDVRYPVSKLPLQRLSFSFEDNAEEQSDAVSVIANELLMDYLALIIKRKNNREKPVAQWSRVDAKYVSLTVPCPYLSLTDKEIAEAFSPSSPDVDMLILRQILRETGSASNSYAAGIRLVRKDDVCTFVITLPAIPHS